MSRQKVGDPLWSKDDLELELRQLPGVRAAGFEELDDMLLVQLHVAERADAPSRADRSQPSVPVSASRIAARHSDRPVTVEVVRWRTALPAPGTPQLPPGAPSEVGASEIAAGEEGGEHARARLLAVLAFPETDELEVHLVLDGKRTIGRAAVSKGIVGTVEATIDAVRDLGTEIQPRIRWARALDIAADDIADDDDDAADADAADDAQVVVAVALDGVDEGGASQYGLAAGTSLIDAAARATLDALNRRLGREL
jgi:hypothetical protein